MTETQHARGRRAALAGLLAQIVVTLGIYVLAFTTRSMAVMQLSFYLATGVPVWLATLLVLRQMELASLEKLDLEQLRRDKQSTGGGAAMFGQEGAAGLGFLVAQTRLEWMLKFLLPAFGLGSGLITILIGSFQLWRMNVRFGFFDLISNTWWPLTREALPLAMILMSLVCLVAFFLGRYATGMARVSDWQLLRGCGGYMLGNSLATLAVIIGIGAALYSGNQSWDRAMAFIIPILMILIGFETLIAWTLDLYRPRTPGTIARAAYDSRLMGLIFEPGGIAHSLREAINYQFGFQVTHSWFYQLLERAAVPLIWIGAVALWLLSTVVVVEPYEEAVIEHWGRQVNADHPLGPGLHFKLPWPIESVERFNTGQLHEFEIGFKAGYTHAAEERDAGTAEVELWTDEKHSGQEHFTFILPPPPRNYAETQATASAPVLGQRELVKAPVNLTRMHVEFQYRLKPDGLAAYTRNKARPEDLLKAIAWNEVLQMAASTEIDTLMGLKREALATRLRDRVTRRAAEADLGYEIVYVAILGVHPDKTVSEAFRRVVTAQQEVIADLRKVQVEANRMLTAVAGERERALALAVAINKVNSYDDLADAGGRALAEGPSSAALLKALGELESKFAAAVEAERTKELARELFTQLKSEFDQGLGRSLRQRQDAEAALARATALYDAAQKELVAATGPVLEKSGLPEAVRTAAMNSVRGRVGHQYWSQQLEQGLIGMEGDAAVLLARAQATRYEREMRAAGEVAKVLNERQAYEAAPAIYRARRYLDVLTVGLRDVRKFLLAFDPTGRQVRVTYNASDVATPDVTNVPLEKK